MDARHIKLIGGEFDGVDWPWSGQRIIEARKPDLESLGMTDDGGPEVYAYAARQIPSCIIQRVYTVRHVTIGDQRWYYGAPQDWTDAQALTLLLGEPL